MFEQLRNRKPGIIEIDIRNNYSVLVPLLKTDQEYSVLFEVRSDKLRQQPGEICLPGGRREIGETTKQTAIRETCEELLIKDTNINVIAPLDVLVSPFNFAIYPYLGFIQDYQWQYNEDEVADVFKVPLDFFMENKPEVYYNKLEMKPSIEIPYADIADGNRYQWTSGQYEVDFYRYKDKVIWGVTAKIIKSLVNIMIEL